MRWIVRIRFELARRPWIVWIGAGTVSLVLVGAVQSQFAAARAARATWGESRVVLVATAPVAAGTPVASAPLRHVRVPVAVVPLGAPSDVDGSAIVVRSLVTGEIVTDADVGGGDPRFALVPPGHVVVALAGPQVALPLSPGDIVEVSARVDGELPLEARATVVSDQGEVLLLAVEASRAAAVARAATDSLRPPAVVLVPPQG